VYNYTKMGAVDTMWYARVAAGQEDNPDPWFKEYILAHEYCFLVNSIEPGEKASGL